MEESVQRYLQEYELGCHEARANDSYFLVLFTIFFGFNGGLLYGHTAGHSSLGPLQMKIMCFLGLFLSFAFWVLMLRNADNRRHYRNRLKALEEKLDFELHRTMRHRKILRGTIAMHAVYFAAIALWIMLFLSAFRV